MKKVFSNSELPHIWAKQTQDEGRGSSIFFDGTKIYSYGRHFCMGNIIQPGIVLFTTRGYSNSTAKHLAYTSYAINHMEMVMCAYPENDREAHIKNLEAWKNQIQCNIDILNNPRKRPQTKDAAKSDLNTIVNLVERYCEVTKFDINKKQTFNSEENTRKEFLLFFAVAKDLQALPDLQKKLERKAKADKKAQDKKDAERKAERLKDLLDWRKGHKKNIYGGSFSDEPVYLRVIRHALNKPNADFDLIETSRGARVSYKAGKLLFECIQAGRDVKGYDIDGYTVISVNGSLKIGCHEIDMKEVRRFAKKEGWTK